LIILGHSWEPKSTKSAGVYIIKSVFALTGVFFLLFAVLYSPKAAAKLERVTVAYYDYPPVFILNKPDSPGYAVEIVTNSFAAQGVDVELIALNLPRAIALAEDAEVDVIAAINPFNSERLALSTIPIVAIDYFLWVPKSASWTYSGPSSLENLNILSIIGYDYRPASPAFQKYLNQHPDQVTYLTGDKPLQSALQMLNRKRADVIALDRDNTQYHLNNFGMSDSIKIAGRLPKTLKGYMATSLIHPNKEEILATFAKGYAKIFSTDRLLALKEKYALASPLPTNTPATLSHNH
jgi:ABC-type amino acid transport substrate-binding protein